MDRPDLHWLPAPEGWAAKLRATKDLPADDLWPALVALANANLDVLATGHLDRALRDGVPAPPAGVDATRLAVLGSATLSHLLPAIRIAGCRRNTWITTYEAHYGLYRHELDDPASGLHAFAPTALLLSFDARHLVGHGGPDSAADAFTLISDCWRAAARFNGPILQQTVLPVFPALMGSNEHRLASSGRELIRALNDRLRAESGAFGVDLVDVERLASDLGLSQWHRPALWFGAKQEISPAAAPLYGDLVARVLAARRGQSAKCLVLDLDNTLWGGVIGEDGLAGIALGQGSAAGEAYLSFQAYVRNLADRGIILAVCSKNNDADARLPFERHPEMALKLDRIAVFVANWEDKASNIRRIADTLGIGLDAIVFFDDSPFERNLVRAALPMVRVLEVPPDPAAYARCIADSGVFESVGLTTEDRTRTGTYVANRARASLAAQSADIGAYLESLDMGLIWAPVDAATLARTTQLVNKTNQFNLTTRRYGEAEVAAFAADASRLALQFRLVDRFGDNGIIAVILGRAAPDATLHLDSWLMSCRVLKRAVERAMLNVLVAACRERGIRELLGVYRPTAKNVMVKDHYRDLGFERCGESPDGETQWRLALSTFVPLKHPIRVEPARAASVDA